MQRWEPSPGSWTGADSSQQIRFMEMIIDRLVSNGVVEPGQLDEPPFTGIHYDGLDGTFSDVDADATIRTSCRSVDCCLSTIPNLVFLRPCQSSRVTEGAKPIVCCLQRGFVGLCQHGNKAR